MQLGSSLEIDRVRGGELMKRERSPRPVACPLRWGRNGMIEWPCANLEWCAHQSTAGVTAKNLKDEVSEQQKQNLRLCLPSGIGMRRGLAPR